LLREPDSAAGGFGLGPRTLVRTVDLADSALLGAGSLFETEYRLPCAPAPTLPPMRGQAEDQFRDKGMRWTDSRRAAPGIERFVERIGSFLVLVGLAGLAVGGVGVSAAVRAYLEGKIATIATLKTLGATGGTIFRIYLMQVGVLTAVGVALGLMLGAGVPLLLAPLLTACCRCRWSLPFIPRP
jgi:putative ABC transport system permease protein